MGKRNKYNLKESYSKILKKKGKNSVQKRPN